MPDYLVTIPIKGEVTFAVRAIDPEEAIKQAEHDFSKRRGIMSENILKLKLSQNGESVCGK